MPGERSVRFDCCDFPQRLSEAWALTSPAAYSFDDAARVASEAHVALGKICLGKTRQKVNSSCFRYAAFRTGCGSILDSVLRLSSTHVPLLFVADIVTPFEKVGGLAKSTATEALLLLRCCNPRRYQR